MPSLLQFELANVKCGGCANSIRKAVEAVPQARVVALDPASGHLEVEADPALRAQIAERLRALGYPEQGTVEGLAAMAASAKSFVSCAVGRLGSED